MYRKFLFILYVVILLLSFFWSIKFYNYPLQTILVTISLFFGLLVYKQTIKEIIMNKKYTHLRFYYYYYLSLIIVLVYHDLINHSSSGILKSISMLIYLTYSIILVYILEHKKYLLLTLSLFFLVLFIYSIGYIFNFRYGQQIKFFIFENRTNLAWFLLFLYVLTVENLSKNIRIIQGSIVFGLLLINSSRSPIIVFLIINLYFYKDIFLSNKAYKLKLIALPLLIFVFYLLSDYFTLATERLLNITNTDYSSSTGYRLSVIIDSFYYSLENFLGHGYSSFVDIFSEISNLDLSSKEGEFSADNSFIEILIDAGWLPFILLILFFYKMFKSENYNIVLIFFLTTLMLFDSIVYNNFWTLLIISSLIINANNSKFVNKII